MNHKIAIHYIYGATHSNSMAELCQNNSFLTTMQLHYIYTHNVVLMSLIVIHPLKFDMWHYEDFWT
jgi:hypothetical protein